MPSEGDRRGINFLRKSEPGEPGRGLARSIREIMLAAEASSGTPRAVPRPLEDVLAETPETKITPASLEAALARAERNLPLDRERLLAHCAGCAGLRSAAFFGSILREDFLANSDVDLLLDCGGIIPKDWIQGFEQIFGRKVDALSAQDWMRGENPIRKALVGNSKRTFYAR